MLIDNYPITTLAHNSIWNFVPFQICQFDVICKKYKKGTKKSVWATLQYSSRICFKKTQCPTHNKMFYLIFMDQDRRSSMLLGVIYLMVYGITSIKKIIDKKIIWFSNESSGASAGSKTQLQQHKLSILLLSIKLALKHHCLTSSE